jgi:aspartate racemase
MKKIGIVGGVGWPSTVEYYSEICRRCEESTPPQTPEISIESLDLSKAVSYIGVDPDEDSWLQFDEYHRAALQRLAASGADFALIASNTPHHRLEAIVRGVTIPILSIFEAAAKESARIGAVRVLILGTALTMSSQVFRNEFAKYGIEAAAPDAESMRSWTVALIKDLQLGKLEGAAEQLGRIAKSSSRKAVCLACTELPLAFPREKRLPTFESDGILYINSTIAHVNAALNFALDETEAPYPRSSAFLRG